MKIAPQAAQWVSGSVFFRFKLHAQICADGNSESTALICMQAAVDCTWKMLVFGLWG